MTASTPATVPVEPGENPPIEDDQVGLIEFVRHRQAAVQSHDYEARDLVKLVYEVAPASNVFRLIQGS